MITTFIYSSSGHKSYILLLVCLAAAIAAVVVNGEEPKKSPVLVFNGKLINDLGEPIHGAHVQFWQTDNNGNYKHPASGAVTLDERFQYFGTAMTAEDGSFLFRTYRPGMYPQRPITHIHYKVWVAGNDILTSQFYFQDEGFTQFSEMLQLELTAGALDDTVVTSKTIVVDLGFNGPLTLTPSQQEGPFYPVVDFFALDSDLTNVTVPHGANDNVQGTPTPETTPRPSQSGVAPILSMDPQSLFPSNNGLSLSSPTNTTLAPADPFIDPTKSPSMSASSSNRRIKMSKSLAAVLFPFLCLYELIGYNK